MRRTERNRDGARPSRSQLHGADTVPGSSALSGLMPQDPRSPTAVPLRASAASWFHQVALDSEPEHVPTGFECEIRGVAMHAECDLDARLIITAFGGERVEIPAAYLAHLWPAALKLSVPVFVDRQGFHLDLLPSSRGLVVLLGAKHSMIP